MAVVSGRVKAGYDRASISKAYSEEGGASKSAAEVGSGGARKPSWADVVASGSQVNSYPGDLILWL